MRLSPRGRRRAIVVVTAAVAANALMIGVADAAIVIGKGIGGATLGASEAQVKHALGNPNSKANSGNQLAWYYTGRALELSVYFDRHGRVNSMFTDSRKQKTDKGIGPGSSYTAFRRAYPRAACKTDPTGHFCTVKTRLNGRRVSTVFAFFVGEPGAREVDINYAG